MREIFTYERVSNSGRLYNVPFTVEVTPNGWVFLEAEFSLAETLGACPETLMRFLKKAMTDYHLGVAEFPGRVNHGHPVNPANRGGRYFVVDGKLYRHDKHLEGVWFAPVSDLRRILAEIREVDDKNSCYMIVKPL